MENQTVLSRRAFGSVAAVAALALTTTGAARAAIPSRQTAASTAPLTNLAHLDFLLVEVPLVAVEGHTTWQIAERPLALAPWTYADGHPDGSYTPVGGGTKDSATGYWSQGAFNADDISRTAVVYLRHWTQTGNADSRYKALDLLRDLAFLQTTTGPDAGNMILWQQPDGTLNPSAEPVELPDPSDSAESYWLARTVWAFGEGYAAFLATDPEFARFLQERLTLVLASLNKQSLAKYGSYDTADGVPVPAWLIAGGADASAEAVLGLTSYVKAAPGDAVAAKALLQLSEGIAAMSAGSTGEWPFGAIMPWTKSRSLWHAWGGMAPAAVAGAGTLLNRQDFLDAALLDSAQFTPQLLVSGGPDNAWSPVPGEAQIAYGVDSRLQGLVATAAAAGSPGLLELAAVVAGWYFGANKSGQPAYNPATGTAIDGIETDGRVNQNSGAESTIHALLSMLLLDANPGLKAKALGIDRTVDNLGLTVVEAESGAITGGAVVEPESAWTGEANISGGAYVALNAGGSVSVEVPGDQYPRNIYPIINQFAAASGTTAWSAGQTNLGSTANGGAGDQGITDAPGILFPFSLQREFLSVTTIVGRTNGPVNIDGLLLQPQVSSVTVDGPAGRLAIFASAALQKTERRMDLPRGYRLRQYAFDAFGRPVAPPANQNGLDNAGRVAVAPGGFTSVSVVRK